MSGRVATWPPDSERPDVASWEPYESTFWVSAANCGKDKNWSVSRRFVGCLESAKKAYKTAPLPLNDTSKSPVIGQLNLYPPPPCKAKIRTTGVG